MLSCTHTSLAMFQDSLLLPSSFAGFIIGKGGSVIHAFEKRSNVKIYTFNEGNACRFLIKAETLDALNAAKLDIKKAVEKERVNRLLTPALSLLVLDRDLRTENGTVHFVPFRIGVSSSNGITASTNGPVGLPWPCGAKHFKVVYQRGPLGFTAAASHGDQTWFVQALPSSENFCDATALPRCLSLFYAELQQLIQTDAQVSLKTRLGHQVFSDVVGPSMSLTEWCALSTGRPVQPSFRVGLENVGVLLDWLYVSGFEMSKFEQLTVVHYSSIALGGRVTATLRWDDAHGGWIIIKLRERYKRVADVAFIQPMPGFADFRLSLSSRASEIGDDPVFERYLHDMQNRAVAQQTGKTKLKFRDTSEILFECVEYQEKTQYRNDDYNITVTQNEQDVLDRASRHDEVSVSHLAWKTLKSASTMSRADRDAARMIERLAKEAVSVMDSTVGFVRKLMEIIRKT